MGIEFEKAFGVKKADLAPSNNRGGSSNNDERVKAMFWLNIGYYVEIQNKEGETEDRFVSLPTGIPLDTMEHIVIRGQNKDYNAFQSARNSLLDQIMEVAKTLQPGEDKCIGEGALVIQIRRVMDEVAEVSETENQFARKLELA